MYKFISVAALAAVTMLLGACGGGGNFSGSAPQLARLTTPSVTSSVAPLPADGSATATITATATDASGSPVVGTAVTFTSDNGTVTTNQGTTDAAGKATATPAIGTATPGTQMKVTATATSSTD